MLVVSRFIAGGVGVFASRRWAPVVPIGGRWGRCNRSFYICYAVRLVRYFSWAG